MDGLELSAVIAELRASLSEAQNEGEGKNLRFSIDDIEVELNVAVEDKGSAEGGVKFYVLSAKAGVSETQTVTQKVKLKMKVLDTAQLDEAALAEARKKGLISSPGSRD
jgi:hypothetical protein